MSDKKLLVITVEKILLLAVWSGAKIKPNYIYTDDLSSAWIFVRPGLREFLDYCFANFRVGLWTEYQPEMVMDALKRIYGDEWSDDRLEFLLTSSDLVPVSDNRFDIEGMFRLRSRCKSLDVIADLGYSQEEVIIIDSDPKVWEPYGRIPPETWVLADNLIIGFGSIIIGDKLFKHNDRSLMRLTKQLRKHL
ncbi:NIF family HAD-type phosphatase [Mariprofundus erugo]|uniref:NIF family HAD-type phosphatase n=1 Tax=Mariprofundus erugo TaxID=2528639 RepID=UPI0013873ED2|nr:NIF family HAD-type phosphatase [Mariprofundus erugo]